VNIDDNQIYCLTEDANVEKMMDWRRNNFEFFLDGLSAIGEKTTAWNFSLPDGTNTPRQLPSNSADVTPSARYTPWGDTSN
jgi:hypothetical protein